MTRSAQTDLAVLATLSIGPMSGYAVREAIRDHLGAFWAESFGQIYPALARLRDEGLVVAVEGDRAGSSVHRLTRSGRARLRKLLAQEPTVPPPRSGVLLRVFFGDVLGPEVTRGVVLQSRRRAEQQLADLAVARAEAEAEPDVPQSPYWLMTVSAGEHAARATIAWADETIRTLDALDP